MKAPAVICKTTASAQKPYCRYVCTTGAPRLMLLTSQCTNSQCKRGPRRLLLWSRPIISALPIRYLTARSPAFPLSDPLLLAEESEAYCTSPLPGGISAPEPVRQWVGGWGAYCTSLLRVGKSEQEPGRR